MKVFNFELKKRVASDVITTDSLSGVSLILICSHIIFDSIKRSFTSLNSFYYKRKYSEKKIIKLLDEQAIYEAARFILVMEGEKRNEYLIFLIDTATGKKSEDEILKFAEDNKKKVEKLRAVNQQ